MNRARYGYENESFSDEIGGRNNGNGGDESGARVLTLDGPECIRHRSMPSPILCLTCGFPWSIFCLGIIFI
ncbi:uncharacterized protein V1513DRAFT_403253 [Lipomyces chichibuensis]|uniref:uncharacterized protein n=1 Tax=Lipomyces chichibuensis TaxID=1546026 RepID=UPI003343AA92